MENIISITSLFIVPLITLLIIRLIRHKSVQFCADLICRYILCIAVFNSALIIPAEILKNHYNSTLVFSHPRYLVFSVIFAVILIAIYTFSNISVILNIGTAKHDKIKKEKLVLPFIISSIGIILLIACMWMKNNYDVDLREIIFTVKTSMDGANTSVIGDAVLECLPFLAAITVCLALVFIIVRQNKIYTALNFKIGKKQISFKLSSRFNIIICCIIFITSILCVNHQYGIARYFYMKLSKTTIYEDYYVEPSLVEITPSKEKRNLILIYLESMETTYSSSAEGGIQPENYIPNLTQLAKEEVNFTSNGLLGGFHNTVGSDVTMTAIFSSTTAIPYSFPTDNTSAPVYASGVTSLFDILERDGYSQYFICGSDADYGGRKKYMTDHGNFSFFDYHSAREEGYTPEDYFVWWGFEDHILFDIAKDKLTQISQNDEPFNYTMITVDTHFPDGFICEKCDDKYPTITANVVACTDKLVREFIDWCKEQPFYENTSIVLMGDHPRMDLAIVDGAPDEIRTTYCCFVNSDADKNLNTNRVYTQLDIYPSILHTLGYEIEGNRLALGTNLFSDVPTLAEQLGVDYLNNEFQKGSNFYEDNFS